MGNEEEELILNEKSLKEWYELYKDLKFPTYFITLFLQQEEEERKKKQAKELKKFCDKNKGFKFHIQSLIPSFFEEEERNDVYIYKTIKYPPKSTPPEAN